MKRLVLLVSGLVFSVSVNAAEILHYVDSDSGLVGAALTELGETATTTSHGAFQTDLASQAWDLVIVDVPGSSVSSGNVTSLDTYINGGGLSIVSAYTYGANLALSTAYDVAAVASFNSPLEVFVWNPAHPIFTGVGGVTDYDQDAGDNGDRLDPINGAEAVAGFTPTLTAGESAIVIGNAGQTIANGWLFWDAELTPNNITLVANQVDFLLTGGVTPVSISTEPVPSMSKYGIVFTVLCLFLLASSRLYTASKR